MYFFFSSHAVLALLYAVTIHALSSVAGSILPAATIVPEKGLENAALFEWETPQLTDAVVSRVGSDALTADIAHLYGFAESGDTKRAAANLSCKNFPGDSNWPSEDTWTKFNALLGDALVPTVPLAAPCYDSKWGAKDLNRCNKIIDSFTTSITQ